MSIEKIGTPFRAQIYAPQAQAEKNAPARKERFVRNEKVELSQTKSQSTTQLETLASIAPEIRIPLVEELKARIKNNDYPLENNLDEALKKMMQGKILDAVA